jgi:MFS family permease
VTDQPLDAGQKLLAVGLVLGVTLVAFEATAVITALPTITDELGGDSLYGVALASYTLANLVALVAAGMLADRHGPLLPYVGSIGVFITGLVVSGTADSMVVVTLGRTLQGAGTGGLAPIAYILVTRAFPEARRPTMYAFLSAGWVLPSLFAPFIAGAIVESVGWRWVFLAIIPLAVAVAALASVPMRRFGPDPDAPRTPWSRLGAAFAAAAGVGALVVGLQSANALGATALVICGLALAVPTLRHLMPAGTWTARTGLPAIVAARILATAAFLGVNSFVPLAADRVHGVSAVVQGFVIIGAALAWTAGQAVMARNPGADPARAVRAGFACLFVGVLITAPVLWSGWPLWATFVSWCVGGFGMGLLFNPTSVTSMTHATPGAEGTVSSQVSLADALGFSLMGGIGGGLVAWADRGGADITTALAISFSLAAAVAATGLFAARGIRPA